ncbi:MAG: glycine cleavage system aminomethyltransferase GcvT [Gemmatimonas sp.]|nr:glycine cleavage system aminomethyltransferase GcvT [Gemmatimonas sp.]
MSEALRRTPLYSEHVAAGGKLVPFAGYEMPVQYPAGITAEHNAVRTTAGLFDVSHMGEFEITGPQALDLVQFVSSNEASALDVGQAQYSTLPGEDGNLLDDLLVYRFADRYMLVVNAANREKDFAWISRFLDRFDAKLIDRSDEIALLALQGPHAAEVLQKLASIDLAQIAYYRFANGEIDGSSSIISRTGYTGEDGFELYLVAEDAAHLWRAILRAGESLGVMPAGLGARDSLRLEMGYALYGNDLDETRNPLEAGLGWVTKLNKGRFVAGDTLRRVKEEGPAERLVGFRLLQRGFPRPGYDVRHSGRRVGKVTSGTLSPSLGVGIGLTYLPTDLAKPGTAIEIQIRGQPIDAEVVRPPFYTDGSIPR